MRIMQSVIYNYVRSLQLEGTFNINPPPGVWGSTALRVHKGWGGVDTSEWPGADKQWPPVEPPDLDTRAKANRILAYHRVSTVDECRMALASESPVFAAFSIDDSWYAAPKGVIAVPSGQAIVGSHAVCLAGYSDTQRHFIIRNSWGTGWGDEGYGYLPYDYFLERFLEGWLMIDRPPQQMYTGGIHSLAWGVLNPLNCVLHGLEVYDGSVDEMIAWSFAIERAGFLDIEELFVRPNWRMHGYARQLAVDLVELASRLGKGLRTWIPHSDAGMSNRPALHAVLRHLGLSLQPCPERWAAALGIGAPP